MTISRAKQRPVGSGTGGRELPRLDQHVCFALYSASGFVTGLYRPLLEPLGLTYPQYLVMLVLWEKSPRSVGDISAALALEPATLTPVLKRLEANGLVTRKRDPRDERRVLVEPTADGQALKARAADVPYAMLCQLPLEEGELRQLHGILNRIAGSASAPRQSTDGE